mmetsp:Transcript_56639/g.82878  ORF Transcript_56639/g.82878 Transcript_56639/m.82878 type:complete len:85 (+) Transcript_56639:76-330(+)
MLSFLVGVLVEEMVGEMPFASSAAFGDLVGVCVFTSNFGASIFTAAAGCCIFLMVGSNANTILTIIFCRGCKEEEGGGGVVVMM